MINSKKIEQFIHQMKDALPKGIRNLSDNMEKSIYPILQNQINRMNLISRDEFIIQTQALLRTQEKLNQLELRLNILETHLKDTVTKESTSISPVPIVNSTTTISSSTLTLEKDKELSDKDD